MTLLRVQKYIPAAPEYILICKKNITLSKPVLSEADDAFSDCYIKVLNRGHLYRGLTIQS